MKGLKLSPDDGIQPLKFNSKRLKVLVAQNLFDGDQQRLHLKTGRNHIKMFMKRSCPDGQVYIRGSM